MADKDDEVIYTKGNTIDLCEENFNDLPISLSEVEFRLSIVKVLKH